MWCDIPVRLSIICVVRGFSASGLFVIILWFVISVERSDFWLRKCVCICKKIDVFSTVHHSIGLFLQPTLMHNSITTGMSHYYPRHVSGLDMPVLRRNNCTNTASGIELCIKVG